MFFIPIPVQTPPKKYYTIKIPCVAIATNKFIIGKLVSIKYLVAIACLYMSLACMLFHSTDLIKIGK